MHLEKFTLGRWNSRPLRWTSRPLRWNSRPLRLELHDCFVGIQDHFVGTRHFVGLPTSSLEFETTSVGIHDSSLELATTSLGTRDLFVGIRVIGTRPLRWNSDLFVGTSRPPWLEFVTSSLEFAGTSLELEPLRWNSLESVSSIGQRENLLFPIQKACPH